MTPADALSLATLVALILLGLALLIAAIRIVIGPTLADRVLALDLLTVVAMGFVGAIAIRTGLMLYLDIAIALALLGFLATVALARYILSRVSAAERDGS
ncbi:MAG: cation:proton antiporter [Devosia sp.]|jgi:multicomponent Na+:H+ antiporter subunit F|uniref:cation:proton antiporter n=1 Tax=Devosia sp. XGJD_8 TaxID=3391187 RepID=UPI003943A621